MLYFSCALQPVTCCVVCVQNWCRNWYNGGYKATFHLDSTIITSDHSFWFLLCISSSCCRNLSLSSINLEATILRHIWQLLSWRHLVKRQSTQYSSSHWSHQVTVSSTVRAHSKQFALLQSWPWQVSYGPQSIHRVRSQHGQVKIKVQSWQKYSKHALHCSKEQHPWHLIEPHSQHSWTGMQSTQKFFSPELDHRHQKNNWSKITQYTSRTAVQIPTHSYCNL